VTEINALVAIEELEADTRNGVEGVEELELGTVYAHL
jgi:hypothetical protein